MRSPGDADMNSSVRVLHLEDNLRDAELIHSVLSSEGLECEIIHVKNREEFEAKLTQDRFDIILSDFSIPEYDGLSALVFAKRAAPSVPFILLSGTLGEEVAVESLKTGATDYILKERLNRLGPAVKRAITQAHDGAARKRADQELKQQAEALARSNAELMRFNRLTIGRELQMVELKREINELCRRLGEGPRYNLDFLSKDGAIDGAINKPTGQLDQSPITKEAA